MELLVSTLVIVDLLFLAAVFYLNRRQTNHEALLTEITEERHMLTEMRKAVHDEMMQIENNNKELLKKMNYLAAEVEQEAKASSGNVTGEIEKVAADIQARFDEPLKQLTKKHIALEALLKRVDQERNLLLKVIDRGEKITRFFDQKMPYEDLLEEIKDKKYSDARLLLAQGHTADKVAKELGMPVHEVKLIAELA